MSDSAEDAETKAALARKKRKEILSKDIPSQKKVQKHHDISTSKQSFSNKYLNTYDPEEPMTKEEEVQWRREARKARNRASAAASRDKTKTRIQELEMQVHEWKQKYLGIMDRLNYLEEITSSKVTPVIPDSECRQVSPSCPTMATTATIETNGIPLLLAAATQSVPNVITSMEPNQDGGGTIKLHLISELSSRQASSNLCS